MSRRTNQLKKATADRRSTDRERRPSTPRNGGRARSASPGQTAPGRPSAARRWGAAALLLALLIAVGLGWQARRRATAQRAAPADAREARLLQAVQARPVDGRARAELAAYYLENRQPFAALWQLAVAQESAGGDAQLSLPMARALRQAGLPDAALRLLTKDRARPASDADGLIRAQLDLEMADPGAAVSVLRGSPTLARSPDGLLLQAQSSLALGDLPAARAAARRYHKLAGTEGSGEGTPTAGSDALALGRLALAMRDTAMARAILSAAADDHPLDEAAQYYAGLAYADSPAPADREKAVGYFKQATRADPHQARAGVELARLLFEKTGQWERAAAVYRQALSMEPQSLPAEEGLARARAALKQPDEAIYHQARVAELKERPEQALPLYRHWGALRPERPDSILRASECSMDMQRYVDAAREVRRGLERFPKEPELFSHLTQLLIRTDDRPEAEQLCARWAPLDPSTGRPEWVRGQLASHALRHDEAIRWFEAAVRKNPALGVYHGNLAQELALAPTPEHLRQARAELEQAATLSPPIAQFPAQLGLVLQQLGELEGARQAFSRALDRDPNRLDAYRGLMAVTRQLRHPGAAAFLARLEREVRDCQREETAARRAVWRQPTDAPARLALARLLLRRGRLPEARNHLAAAAEQPDGAAARPLLRRVERLQSVL